MDSAPVATNGSAPIHVRWIGAGPEDAALLESVRLRLAQAFGRPAETVSAPQRPEGSWDPRRRQHASGTILRWLAEAGPAGGKILGITDHDLFIPVLSYVIGEANLGGAAAVLSTARLREDPQGIGRRLLEARVVKEAVHEMGHAFGLVHCRTPRCAMRRSSSVSEVDAKSHELCAACRERVASDSR